ncbi:MAG: RNA polymerase sigma factor [Acidobacteria bacterium]|nr:RNA polymerase sigma factor [Acidobacteriota bacterium]
MAERGKGSLSERVEELYRQHKDKVFRIALRMIGEEAAAEDIVQEVFLTLLKKVDGFRNESEIFSWIYRITVNKTISHLRWRRVRQLKKLFMIKEGRGKGLDFASKVEFRRKLEESLLSLPAGQRAMFVLHDIEGFTHEEIAEIRGCSSGTVKSQLFRARLRLRKKLSPFLDLLRGRS